MGTQNEKETKEHKFPGFGYQHPFPAKPTEYTKAQKHKVWGTIWKMCMVQYGVGVVKDGGRKLG